MMDEKKLLDKIRDSAKEISVPESLSPQAVEERLAAQENRRKRKTVRLMTQMAAAAALVLVFAITWNRMRLSKPWTVEQEITAETGGEALADAGEKTEETKKTGQEADKDRSAVTTQAENMSGEASEDALAAAGEGETGFTQVESREALYTALARWQEENQIVCGDVLYDTALSTGVVLEDSSSISSTADMGTRSGEGAGAMQAPYESGDYSRTNVQELGVDEGDIVKTDGRYLYVLKENMLKILEVSGAQITEASRITLEDAEAECFRELYVDGSRLVLIAEGSSTNWEEHEEQVEMSTRAVTLVYTYELSRESNPVPAGKIQVDGSYRTSRRNGDYLYLLADYIPELKEDMDGSNFIPKANGNAFREQEILMPSTLDSSNFLVTVSVDLKNPGVIRDKKALVGISEIIYVSLENIYLTRTEWNSGGEKTSIMKFSYQDGELKGKAAGSVPGCLNDNFSLDEYDGKLRVVTTLWKEERENGLYVLDEDLKILGRVENLARGEEIYSARFLGETGYFVTFRNTDPLFSVDLSDPSNPQILGELKVTGFSSYLHFYGDKKLLGIGKEVDPETGEIKGIKLSMFDISDPARIAEENRYIIDGNLECPGIDQYKAILADAGKNVIGLAVGSKYLIFSYDEENGFQEEAAREISGSLWEARGVYLGALFYVVDEKEIHILDMGNAYGILNTISY